MNAKKTIAEIALLGGHPVSDFINTVDARRDIWGPDFLTDYQDLLLWAERTGLIDKDAAQNVAKKAGLDPAGAATALDRAKELREALYRLCLSEGAGTPIASEDLHCLDGAVRPALRFKQSSAAVASSCLPAGAMNFHQ